MATRPTASRQSAPTQEVATVPTGGAVAQATPDFMKKYVGQGTELINQSDIETPRIKLLQAVSPEVEEFDAARAGVFWHTVAEQSLGKEVQVVVVYVDQRAILWRPRHEGGGILARADDGVHWQPANASWQIKPIKGDNKTVVTWATKPLVAASGLLDWGSSIPSDSNSPPAATRMYNLVVALPDFPDLPPGVVTLQRSGIKVARKFLGKLKISGAPAFGMKFTMSSVLDKNASGDDYLNYRFTSAGFVTDEHQFHAYRELYERFKSMGLAIRDIESAQDDAEIEGEASEGEAAY